MQVMAAGETPSLRDLSFSRSGLFSIGSTSHPNWTLGKKKIWKIWTGTNLQRMFLNGWSMGLLSKKIMMKFIYGC